MSGREWLFWNNSLTGLLVQAFVWMVVLPFLLVGWVFKAIWVSELTDNVKLVLTAVWMVGLVVGLVLIT